MQINISGHHIELTSTLKDYAEKRLSKLSKHIDNMISFDLILTVEKLRHMAKANIMVPGDMLHAEAESEDMYAAIDLLVDKLDRQAIKYKEKLHHHSREDGDEVIR